MDLDSMTDDQLADAAVAASELAIRHYESAKVLTAAMAGLPWDDEPMLMLADRTWAQMMADGYAAEQSAHVFSGELSRRREAARRGL